MRRHQSTSTSSDGVAHIDKSCSAFNDETTALLSSSSPTSHFHSPVSTAENSSSTYVDTSDTYSSCSSNSSILYYQLDSTCHHHHHQNRDEGGDGDGGGGEDENNGENESAECSPLGVTGVGCNRPEEPGAGVLPSSSSSSSCSPSQPQRAATERPQLLNVTSTTANARQRQLLQLPKPKCNLQRICTTRAIPSILKRTLSEGVKVPPPPLSTLQRRHQQLERQQQQQSAEVELSVCPIHHTTQSSTRTCIGPTRHSILKHNLATNRPETSSFFGGGGGMRKTTNLNFCGEQQPSSKTSNRRRYLSGDETRWRFMKAPRHSEFQQKPNSCSKGCRQPGGGGGVSNSISELAPYTTAMTTGQVCTCSSAVGTGRTKSVSILTPTKSEEILFDPAASVAASFIAKKNAINNNIVVKEEDEDDEFNDDSRLSLSLPKTGLSGGLEYCNYEQQPSFSQQHLFRCRAQPATALFCDQSHASQECIDKNSAQCCSSHVDHHHNHHPTQCSTSSLTNSTTLECTNSVASLCHHHHHHKDRCDENQATVLSMPPDVIYQFEDNNENFDNLMNQLQHHHQQQQPAKKMMDLLEVEEDEGETSSSSSSDAERPKYCTTCSTWFHSWDASYPARCNCVAELTGGGGGGGGAGDKSSTLNTIDTVSIYSISMQKDFRYYLQHPYSRLFVAYCVIFCNFLIFAEDPLSHSQIECSIPILGNVISFLLTKYPISLRWALFKGSLALVSIVCGLIFGKYVLHHIVLRNWCRLKMFRNESGTWMIMLLSTFFSSYLFSILYNMAVLILQDSGTAHKWMITSQMGITYACFMKVAACGTWLGDFATAWMITDMMLQDNLYPWWAKPVRRFWHKHTTTRIVVFWAGAIVIATTVVTIILSDAIVWDSLVGRYFSTTELSRAFLASAILVMDLLIVIQDWDFPHFVCDLNIKLPGMLRPSYTINIWRRSKTTPVGKGEVVTIKISGKWFNYGIIVFVMLLDLNMWKNQVIYKPSEYGQYVHPVTKMVHTVNDTIAQRKALLVPDIKWNYNSRLAEKDPATNKSLVENDLMVYARYFGYPFFIKALSLFPIAGGFIGFFSLIYLHGRYPPKTDRSGGGRYKKRRHGGSRRSAMTACAGHHYHHRASSWRRERRDDDPGVLRNWPNVLFDSVKSWAMPNSSASYQIPPFSNIRNCEQILTRAAMNGTIPEVGGDDKIAGRTLLDRFRQLSFPNRMLVSQIVSAVSQIVRQEQQQQLEMTTMSQYSERPKLEVKDDNVPNGGGKNNSLSSEQYTTLLVELPSADHPVKTLRD